MKKPKPYGAYPWLLKGRRMLCDFLQCSPHSLGFYIDEGAPVALIGGILRADKLQLRQWFREYVASMRKEG
jgi:hypothetical protein